MKQLVSPVPDPAGSGDLRFDRGVLPARNRAILWLTLAFWLSNYAVLSLNDVLLEHQHLVEVTAARGLLVLLGIALCFLLHRMLRRLGRYSFRRRAITLALVSPVVAEIYAWAVYFGIRAADPTRSGTFSWSAALTTISFWTWFFLAWAGLCLALEYSVDVKEEEQRSSELRALAHDAKLRALHNQVNPHFLFNSLNSISALILDRRIADADRMVARLADFLRTTLAVDATADIKLSEEVALQRAYLDIEQLRYPDLAVDIVLPESLGQALVPALILQPLVENAVKYGVASAPPPAAIAIRATRADGRLAIEVVDSGRPVTPSTRARPVTGGGIGLNNVRQRLSELYGENQSFSAERNAEGGFTARLVMPLVYAG